MVDVGEQCDPTAEPPLVCPAGSPAGGFLPCNLDCTCPFPCCGPERISLTSGPGSLTVSILPPFPFPTGVMTVLDVDTAVNAQCDHPVSVASFSVPTFPIPTLNYCSQVTNLSCAVSSGGKIGSGLLRDGLGPVGALTNVTTSGDTKDGVCDVAAPPCFPFGPGNTLGDIDVAFGASASAGARNVIEVPQNSLTWSEVGCIPCKDPDCSGCTPGGVDCSGTIGTVCDPSDGTCCCTGSVFGDEVGDAISANFNFILRPTTDVSSAVYADKNGDGCFMEGLGPVGPVVSVGTPPPGPCCAVGQATTVVSVGIAFSGGPPLFDLIFASSVPNTITACSPFVPGSCVPSLNPCDF
jgi:hypothetical protein